MEVMQKARKELRVLANKVARLVCSLRLVLWFLIFLFPFLLFEQATGKGDKVDD